MQWHGTQNYHKHSKTEPLARITIILAALARAYQNREFIQDLLPMSNRGSSNTFTGQGFPTSGFGYTEASGISSGS